MVVVARLSIAIAIGMPTFASPNGEMLIKKRSRISLYTFKKLGHNKMPTKIKF